MKLIGDENCYSYLYSCTSRLDWCPFTAARIITPPVCANRKIRIQQQKIFSSWRIRFHVRTRPNQSPHTHYLRIQSRYQSIAVKRIYTPPQLTPTNVLHLPLRASFYSILNHVLKSHTHSETPGEAIRERKYLRIQYSITENIPAHIRKKKLSGHRRRFGCPW